LEKKLGYLIDDKSRVEILCKENKFGVLDWKKKREIKFRHQKHIFPWYTLVFTKFFLLNNSNTFYNYYYITKYIW